MATVRIPSSCAARKTRIAISLRLATRSLVIFGMTGPGGGEKARRLSVAANRRIVKCTRLERRTLGLAALRLAGLRLARLFAAGGLRLAGFGLDRWRRRNELRRHGLALVASKNGYFDGVLGQIAMNDRCQVRDVQNLYVPDGNDLISRRQTGFRRRRIGNHRFNSSVGGGIAIRLDLHSQKRMLQRLIRFQTIENRVQSVDRNGKADPRVVPLGAGRL